MTSCGNPAVETDALMARRLKFDKSRVCVKCKLNYGNIVIRHAVYCKECFTPLQITKFKRALEPTINPASASTTGPHRNKLKAAGNLTIGFSGGLGSTVLLDLISRCYFSGHEPSVVENGKLKGGTKHPRKNEVVWKDVTVCYVEVCGAYPGSGIRDKTEEVRCAVERYDGFQFCALRIEDAFDPAWWARVGGRNPANEQALGVDISDEALPLAHLCDSTSTPLAALQAHLSSLPTTTASQSTVATLIRLLLLYTSLSTSSSHLLLGTTLTGLSIGLISGVAMGGGFVIREEAGEQWVPRSGGTAGQPIIKVVRPLKDIGMKECAAWVWWNGLQVVGKEKVTNGKQGIGGLTKDFIVGLERDYPSTVSTIARTCAKLAPKAAASEWCALCERPAQKGAQDWKTRISIRSFNATETPTLPPHIQPSSSPVAPLHDQNNRRLLTPHLCYACHTTYTSRSSRGTALLAKNTPEVLHGTSVPLPAWVSSRLFDIGSGGEAAGNLAVWQGKRMGTVEMKVAVKDFLLDD